MRCEFLCRFSKAVSSIGVGSHALLKFFDRLCLPHHFGSVLEFLAIKILFKGSIAVADFVSAHKPIRSYDLLLEHERRSSVVTSRTHRHVVPSPHVDGRASGPTHGHGLVFIFLFCCPL
jgi:hypothetical protein